MQERGEREIPKKKLRPAASSGTISTCENLRVTPPGMESGSLRRKPMRVTEMSKEQCRSEMAGETYGRSRENPPINGIVQHDSHMRKAGVTRPGVEPGSPARRAG
ncbi:hypothetical protein PR048_029494 [Dryococelus australis]|uniref:Uncharacterized protein n=1 Tax=Dryococelus australis TaxID=614101 RepID=A0ABQ9GDI3_9NEOP|nr:hypothetical protein PR048_029494 [Dryococelus australis]